LPRRRSRAFPTRSTSKRSRIGGEALAILAVVFGTLKYLRVHPKLLRTFVSFREPPGKDVYKPTITPGLREFLRRRGGAQRTFLEIGCDVGLNLTSLSTDYKRLVGVEIDPARARLARLRSLRLPHVEVIRGTAYDVPREPFDVVLIDAVHLYVNVLVDLLCVLNRSTAPTLEVVFHDFGLLDGEVRDFVGDVFAGWRTVGATQAWNASGQGDNGPEAAWVRIDRIEAVRRIREAIRSGRPAVPSDETGEP
jgi:Methyltransferase domain